MDDEMPSAAAGELTLFDRFATWASRLVSRATFFTLCLAMVVLWGASYPLFSDVDTWQLVINTTTTIVTFILVALLQNSQHRADQALQQKLNAIARAIADSMAEDENLREDREELEQAVGLENRESSRKQ
jgi:low affinity Fe/Cu permease